MRALRNLLLLLVVGGAALSWWAWRQAQAPIALPAGAVQFAVPPGASMRVAAERMAAAGLPYPAWQWAALGRLLGIERRLHAGTYRAESGVTPLALMDKLARGDVVTVRVTIVEGKTLREVRAQLAAREDLAHDTKGLTDEALAAALGLAGRHLEGRLLPETYVIDLGSGELDLLRAASRGMSQALDAVWARRDATSRLRSPDDLLVLASVVEKETGRAEDRGRIARVFANRLKLGMPLQSDPTVIYGLGSRFDGNLRRADLERDTPWNTYTRPGLPPTPIAMPGLASLQAAANPPPGSDLYFVARGDGTSEFSITLEAHNRAVNKFQRGGRGG